MINTRNVIHNSMAKVRKIQINEVECDHCDGIIKTGKTSGKVQCVRCGKRTDLDG